MTNVSSTKSILTAAALSLGLAVAAVAQTTVPVEPPAPLAPGSGLLGQTYGTASYGFIDLDDAGLDAHSFSLTANEAVRDGLDAFAEYEYIRTDRILGSRLTQHGLLVGARAYTNYQGIKPYAEAGVGWVWQKFAGSSENSFAWSAGVGAEFELAPALTVAPFVRYTDLTEGSDHGAWDYGVKGNYWFSEKFSVSGTIARDDDQNMEYRVGVNFRY